MLYSTEKCTTPSTRANPSSSCITSSTKFAQFHESPLKVQFKVRYGYRNSCLLRYGRVHWYSRVYARIPKFFLWYALRMSSGQKFRFVPVYCRAHSGHEGNLFLWSRGPVRRSMGLPGGICRTPFIILEKIRKFG